MLPAREGDGTGLSAPGYSEVRKGDGTVLWSAGADIPDSEDLHTRYDATKLSLSDQDSVSIWKDETDGGYDLTAGTAPTYVADVINGNAAVRFDGSDNYLDVSFSTLSQPNHIFIVARKQTINTGSFEYAFDSDSSETHGFFHTNSDEFRMFAGNSLNLNTYDNNWHIFSLLFNASNSTARVDGVDDATGDVGTQDLSGFQVGSRRSDSSYGDYEFGEILIYPQDKSGAQSDIEQYLADKWGITI